MAVFGRQEIIEALERLGQLAEQQGVQVPGDELKAHYAFADLWEALYGDD